MEFWIKQFITVAVYIGVIIFSMLNFSIETNRVLTPILTTVFVWVMNKTFSIDYQTKNEKELKDYQGKIDKEIEDYKNQWNKKLEKIKNEFSKELEEYKSKLSKYTLITKWQYDFELNAYTEIAKITMHYYEAIDLLKRQALSKNIKEFQESLERLKGIYRIYGDNYYQNRIIYTDEMEDIIVNKIIGNGRIVIQELTSFMLSNENIDFKKIDIRLDAIDINCRELVVKIKARISEMKVVE